MQETKLILHMLKVVEKRIPSSETWPLGIHINAQIILKTYSSSMEITKKSFESRCNLTQKHLPAAVL